MRYFKLRIEKNRSVEAHIALTDAHLDIYKKILRIKTDLGFGNSLRHFIAVEIEKGQNPFVLKALLEHNLPCILASIAAEHLHTFFRETDDDDIAEIDSDDLEELTLFFESKVTMQETNVIKFSDNFREKPDGG